MVNVVFKLTNSHGKQLYSLADISPAISPINYRGSLVCGNAVQVNTQGLSSITVPLICNTYHIRLTGYNANTQFNILLPGTIDNQTVNAKDYITND